MYSEGRAHALHRERAARSEVRDDPEDGRLEAGPAHLCCFRT